MTKQVVTERLLREAFGYTTSQIKRRRQMHWLEGVHYWRDEAGATMYSMEDIKKWTTLQASTFAEAKSGLDGKKARGGRSKSSTTSPIPWLV